MLKFNPQPIIDKFGRMSQEDIAQRIGVSRPTVSLWINGNVERILLDTLSKFATACEVEPGAFFTLTTE